MSLAAVFRRVAILALGVWSCGAPGAGAAEPGFRRFEETISPDGAYVLAWGWRKGGELAALKEWPEDQDSDEGAVANYLVDAVKGQVLAVIPEFAFFRGATGRQNHADIRVAWSADSREALLIYDGRWANEAILWMRPATRTFTDVEEPLKAAYRHLLQTREKRRDPGAIAFQAPALLPGGVVVAYGWAQRPKEEPVFQYRLRFRVKIEGDKAQAELISGRKLPDSSDEPADEAALNAVYGQLRASLDAAGRAALKTEQLAWLKQREAIEDDLYRGTFTTQRVSYLRARLGK